MIERTLEKIAMNAWPAFESFEMDSWVLRFAKGYTKRANSVTILGDNTTNLEDKILFCEAQFRERGLKSIFRLPSFIAPASLDKMLEQRGYDLVDLTYVMQRSLVDWQGHPFNISKNGVGEWLDAYHNISDATNKQNESHLRILTSIQAEAQYCTYQHQEETVACGLGVLENGYFGLFDLVTTKNQRRKGFATALVSGMLDDAIKKAARTAYLQVVQNNIHAVQLYKNLGFTKQYAYWYRVKSL